MNSNRIAEYEIEAIVKHKKTPSGYSYLLKWKGYPSSENSWENEDNLPCKEFLQNYWKKINADKKKEHDQETKTKNKQIEHSADSHQSKTQILGVRKDFDGKILFLILTKKGKKKELSLNFLKNHHPDILISYFESLIHFTSKINVNLSEFTVGSNN